MDKVNLAVLLLISTVSCYAQLKKITPEDYKKGYDVIANTISDDGKWVSFEKKYDVALDTLVIMDAETGTQYNYPGTSGASFSADSRFAVAKGTAGTLLLDLSTGKEEWLEVSRYEFIESFGLIAMLTVKAGKKQLVLRGYVGREHTVDGIVEFAVGAGGLIACSTGSDVSIIDVSKGFSKTMVAQTAGAPFSKLKWNGSDGLAFLQGTDSDKLIPRGHMLWYFCLEGKILSQLDPANVPELLGQRITSPLGASPVQFGAGGDVFFYIAAPRENFVNESPEVWNASTPLEFYSQRVKGNAEHRPKLAAWDTRTGKVRAVADNSRPVAWLLPGGRHAIVYDDLKYLPNTGEPPLVDMYLHNIKTGSRKLLVEKQTTELEMAGVSPDGRYFHYFNGGSWWVYNIDRGTHSNVTQKIPYPLTGTGGQYVRPASAWTVPVWTADGKWLILGDEFDLWLVSPSGDRARRITDGRDTDTKFSIVRSIHTGSNARYQYPMYGASIKKGLMLQSIATDKSFGLHRYTEKGLMTLLSADARISGIKMAGTGQLVYIEETAATPPVVKRLDIKKKNSQLLYASNRGLRKFEWGRVASVKYHDAAGKALEGLLFYPAGYDTARQYPLVVHIYETQSHMYHRFQRPTLYQTIGFSPANYFLDDYLVLLPDIRYKPGEPGMSALDCVTAAVKTVTGMGIVAEGKIGLIGQSFGGYETMFIITQTDLFAAAVAGSGIADLSINYFSRGDLEKSNMFRFEVQQFRIGFSPFDDSEAYRRNSPLENAEGIVTPLLSWVGQKDRTVDWSQTMALHYAMRRLKKENVFLVYPTEGHIMVTPEMQVDLSMRTKSWFDHYLKDRPLQAN